MCVCVHSIEAKKKLKAKTMYSIPVYNRENWVKIRRSGMIKLIYWYCVLRNNSQQGCNNSMFTFPCSLPLCFKTKKALSNKNRHAFQFPIFSGVNAIYWYIFSCFGRFASFLINGYWLHPFLLYSKWLSKIVKLMIWLAQTMHFSRSIFFPL